MFAVKWIRDLGNPLLSEQVKIKNPRRLAQLLEAYASVNDLDVIDVTLTSTSQTDLGITSTDVLTISAAQSSLSSIDAAIDTVNQSRGVLGSQQNRMESALRSIQVQRENLAASESRIRDVDVAQETADLTRNSIMQQAATTILTQANVQPQIALTLLQG